LQEEKDLSNDPEIKWKEDKSEFLEIHRDIGMVYRFNGETKQLLQAYELEEVKEVLNL